jgi:hypothetical protein
MQAQTEARPAFESTFSQTIAPHSSRFAASLNNRVTV